MSNIIVRGQRIKLSELFKSLQLAVRITASNQLNTIYDISCCGLDDTGKCQDERYFIFYNQMESPDKSILLTNNTNNSSTFKINLENLLNSVTRLVFTITIDGNGAMSELDTGSVVFLEKNNIVAHFDFKGADFNKEKAIMIAEIYFKNEWRINAIGQGFNGGLSDLLKHFGIEEEAGASPKNVVPQNAEEFYSKKIKQFQRRLKKVLLEGELTQEKVDKLNQYCIQNNLSIDEMFAEAKNEITKTLHKLLTDISSENKISQQEQDIVNRLCKFLDTPKELTKEINQIVSRVKKIEKINSGDVEAINSKLVSLKNGELIWCHFKKVLSVFDENDELVGYEGDVFVTNTRIIFRSVEAPAEISFAAILGYELDDDDAIYIFGKTKKSTITLLLKKDGDLLHAYINQAINKYNHRLSSSKPLNKTRSIPSEVRNIVWARDGGRCVECGGTEYLEYDHIIPYSKNGSNNENNVQILCRGCNSKKGSKI